MTPYDWDGESYCVHDGCQSPTTHRRPLAVCTDGTFIVETVCPQHAGEADK